MHEVSTSRRAVMRALVLLPTAAMPAAAQTFACRLDFDPADWIRGFVALGGRVSLTAEGPTISHAVDSNIIEHVRIIGQAPERWRAVKAHIASIAEGGRA